MFSDYEQSCYIHSRAGYGVSAGFPFHWGKELGVRSPGSVVHKPLDRRMHSLVFICFCLFFAFECFFWFLASSAMHFKTFFWSFCPELQPEEGDTVFVLKGFLVQRRKTELAGKEEPPVPSIHREALPSGHFGASWACTITNLFHHDSNGCN